MSGNATGSVGRLRAMGTFSTSGNITATQNGTGTYGGSSTTYYQKTLSINVSHTHSHDHVHSITTGYNGDSNNTEARPQNFAIRIWKRTA